MDNNQTMNNLSGFLGVVDAARGLIIDALNNHDLGTTPTGSIGVLGAGLGIQAAVDKYNNSALTSEDFARLVLDLATNIPGVGGLLASDLSFSYDTTKTLIEKDRVRWNKFMEDYDKYRKNMDRNFIDPRTNTNYTDAQKYRRRVDPLTFDLDNDGLETVGISATNPILFDHDGDGTKNGTGWIASDDAMLVLDRNGNGTIDNGRELFGDSTLKSNGQTATDGFDALADIDSNADGVVNNQDTQFTNLKLWRDLNQDGTSQTGELFTLNDLGIASINITNTANSQTLANGNQLTNTGTYTKADGTTGSVADINLANDTFHRQFGNVLNTTTVANLPDMQGSGAVRDLREAATQSTTLQSLLTQYSAATSREAQMALIDQLLDAWADTSGYIDTYAGRVAGLRYTTDFVSVPYVVSYEAFGSITNATYQTGITNIDGGSGTSGGGTIGAEMLTPEFQALINSWNQKIHILEAFNGNYFFGLPANPTEGARTGLTIEAADPNSVGRMIAAPIRIRYDQAQLDLLQQSYDALKGSVYEALLLQTRFKPLLDQINLVIDANGIQLDFTQVTNSFDQAISNNAEAGLVELIDFNFASKDMLNATGWTGWQRMAQQLQITKSSAIIEALKLHGAMVKGTEGFIASGTANNDVIIGDGAADSLSGGEGNDTLIGGAGSDTMNGGNGSDTFAIGTGDGIDSITDTGTKTDTDRVQLAIKSTDITSLLRVGDNLVIKSGTGDQL
ncbi:MAG: hypothetical protein HOP21_08885, partial [Methylotenera sp.]|nr:hypothetical protein [Methylotenera sp.]